MTKRLVSAHTSHATSFVQHQMWLSSGLGREGAAVTLSVSHSHQIHVTRSPAECSLEIAWAYGCAPPVSSNNLCVLGVGKEIAREKGEMKRSREKIPHRNRENVSKVGLMIQFSNHSFKVPISEQDVT